MSETLGPALQGAFLLMIVVAVLVLGLTCLRLAARFKLDGVYAALAEQAGRAQALEAELGAVRDMLGTAMKRWRMRDVREMGVKAKAAQEDNGEAVDEDAPMLSPSERAALTGGQSAVEGHASVDGDGGLADLAARAGRQGLFGR